MAVAPSAHARSSSSCSLLSGSSLSRSRANGGRAVRSLGDPLLRPSTYRVQLFVDAHGILRLRPREPRAPHSQYRPMPADVLAWPAGRKMGGQPGALYWFVLARSCDACRIWRCCCVEVDGVVRHGAHEHYRQGAKMSAEDARRFTELPPRFQEQCRYLEALGPSASSSWLCNRRHRHRQDGTASCSDAAAALRSTEGRR